MDDLKEKLISMIQEAVGGCARHWASLIADRLIANGVTVQELDGCFRCKDSQKNDCDYQQ